MISVGTKSEREASDALEYAKEFLIKKGFAKPTVLEPETQNIVAVADFGRDINLEEVASRSHSQIDSSREIAALQKFARGYSFYE